MKLRSKSQRLDVEISTQLDSLKQDFIWMEVLFWNLIFVLSLVFSITAKATEIKEACALFLSMALTLKNTRSFSFSAFGACSCVLESETILTEIWQTFWSLQPTNLGKKTIQRVQGVYVNIKKWPTHCLRQEINILFLLFKTIVLRKFQIHCGGHKIIKLIIQISSFVLSNR